MASGKSFARHRALTMRVVTATLILALATIAQAGGADRPKDVKAEAKARFMAGQSHYNLNEFAAALVEFKEAYRLLPDPVFLYNSGQCERQLGHFEEAIRFYRSYLREQPKTPNRQDVLHKIDEMEDAQRAKTTEVDKTAAPKQPTAAAASAAPSAIAPPPQQATVAEPPTSLPQSVAVPAQPAAPIGGLATAPTAPVTAPGLGGMLFTGSSPSSAPDTSASAGIDLSSSLPKPAPAGAKPLYARWWFWPAAAVVVVGAGAGIYAATAAKSPTAPASDLGAKGAF
jgi:tetratricopeptide (TPR) repeat protein